MSVLKTTELRDLFWGGLAENKRDYLEWRVRTFGAEDVRPAPRVPEAFETAERCFLELSETDRLEVLKGAPRRFS